MPRLMAIDYGKKRTGLAVTDPLQLIASGLTTIPTHELIPFLKKYFAAEPVETIVIGEPKNLDGTATDATALVAECIRVIKKNFPDIPIVRVDERFTSKMAFQTMIDSGLKKKDRRDKALVDEISATIMLQEYLRNKI
ncbi:Holliday junction resolvase RuvX [Chitinophaga polysaccharea]|uniref:Putative pre-16S rRNA nuclease n=1 Tax=Chitinophaga eiseniae TaxID=634771 RepID=A0A847SIQ4_9BACT|nr:MULTISPECIES: Holliday junction resolvase RuvX [Chitinophaga]NLR61213.1 Holliday junction resolvase RuvX [Chitinophaga polysaccharea]NLR81751.1 Holliday junction resolvase RuvX [Chitinophaga eiseniae]NLU95049.1 Holliday junction resolvase RuvX [Chitinophaga sp. Ak27]